MAKVRFCLKLVDMMAMLGRNIRVVPARRPLQRLEQETCSLVISCTHELETTFCTVTDDEKEKTQEKTNSGTVR